MSDRPQEPVEPPDRPVGERSPRRRALGDLADAARTLVHRVVSTDAPDEVIVTATAEVATTAARFEGYGGARYGISDAADASGGKTPLYDQNPMSGMANPLAPPMAIHVEDDVVVGTVTFGQAYEGPPGCVHGGSVAAAFDELLGATQSLVGGPVLTGTLTVRYQARTPLKTLLRFEGRVVGVDGRKIFAAGTCRHGDVVTASAEGTFFSVDPGQFQDLIAEREAAPGELS